MARIDLFDEKKLEEVQQAIARYVCYDSVSPLKCCEESEGFSRLCRALNPNIRASFSTVESNCLKIYREERENIVETFSKHNGHISLSVDPLVYEASRGLLNEYVCLSAHIINEDWRLQKWVIKYCPVYGVSQSFPNDIILESLREWDIEGKVFSITDGGNTDLVYGVKEELQKRTKLLMNGQLFHVQSCCDVVSRMVEAGYEEISNIIDKVQLLSWSKSEPSWYLTSSKLDQALKLQAMGEFSSKRIRKTYDVPSKDEWGKVRSMCRIADRIYEIVEGLFKVKRPTANLFLPHLQQIQAYLTQELDSSDKFVKSVTQKMLTKFDEYWKDMYLVLAIAAFMDPRYKLKFIAFTSSTLQGGDGNSKATSVLETIRKLYEGYVIQNDQMEYLLSSSTSESEEVDGDEDWDHDEDEGDEEGVVRHGEKRCFKLLDRLDILREFVASCVTATCK